MHCIPADVIIDQNQILIGLFSVIVEADTCLSAKSAATNHLLKKRMRTILRITGLSVKSIHYSENDIKADHIT